MRLALCVAALCVAAGAASAAPNQLPNSSFEQGEAGWSLWHEVPGVSSGGVTDEAARHGQRCFRLQNRESQEAVLHSDPVPVQGGADYTLSAYARTDSAEGVRIALWALSRDQLERMREQGGAPTAWTAGPDGEGILPNGGFEGGAGGWRLWHQFPGRSSGGPVSGQGRNGGVAFHVVNDGSGGANLHSDPVPCEPNATYTLTVSARVRDGRGVRIGGWALDGEGGTLSYAVDGSTELPSNVPGYRGFVKTFVTPANCVQLKAHLTCNGGEVWWDDCRLVLQGESLSFELPYGADLPADQPAWARFKCVVRAPENCAALKVLLISHGGTAWWDAVQLERGRDAGPYRSGPTVGEAGADGRNLLSNSCFEDGEADWDLWHQFPGRSSGEVTAGAGRDGSRAFHVLNPGDGGANLHSEPVLCEPGSTYTLSVYARVKDGRGVAVGGWGVDRRGQVISYALEDVAELPSQVPRFTRFTKTFTAPPDCVLLKAHLICDGGEVWWGDCQLEKGEGPTAYVAGPRVDLLPPREGPQAVAYARAIVREARLRDVLAQTERLVAYAGAARAAQVHASPADARRAVAQVSEMLGAAYLVPDYRSVDYAALDGLTDRAEARLTETWRSLGHDPAGIFDEWRPEPLPGNMDKRALAREFLIFPCFTSDLFFSGGCDWGLLEPFGFRVVSGWWGVSFTRERRLRPAGMDRVIETCAAHGYRCDIAVDPADAAATLLRQRLGDAIYLHNAQGEWSPQGNCHNTINIWHPEVRALATDCLGQIAAHYADNPGVLSYELINEPSLAIERHEHGYRYEPIGVGGYSEPARAAWREWLRRRYGTIEALNARWRSDYGGFDEVAPPADLSAPIPRDARTPVGTGAVHDFQSFRAESHGDWFSLCIEAMHRQDPRKAVIAQFSTSPVDRKEGAVDLRLMAEDVPWDFYGTHDWPGEGPATVSLYVVSMNRRAQLPHWEDEFIWSQWERKGTPEPVMRAALERNLWRQIAWGKRGISLFNLETEWLHDAPGNWNNSMMNIEADLEVPRYSTGVIPTIERKTNLFKDVLYGTSIEAPDVALLRPTVATLVSAPELSARNESIAIAERLLAEHYMPLMIPEEHIISGFDDLSDVTVLIAPWAVNVPDALQERLLEWVESGGVLFATGPFGLFDEYGNPSGTLLAKTLGDLSWQYDAEGGRWHADLERPGREVQGRAVPDSETPLLMAGHGRGRVYLWPEPMRSAQRLDVLRMVLEEAVPVPYVRTDLARIEIVPRVGPSGERYLFVTNLDPRQACEGEVLVRGRFRRVVDLSCEARPQVPVVGEEGVTRIPLKLRPGGAVFLSLGRNEL